MKMRMLATLVAAHAAVFSASTASAADDASCKQVRMSDLGWTDIALTNTTGEIILKALGYEPKQTLLGLNVTYDAMKRGDIDVFLGNWRPRAGHRIQSLFRRWLRRAGRRQS